MLEVPLTGEYHGDTLLVGLPDRILVADRTAGLHNRRHAVFGGQRLSLVVGFLAAFVSGCLACKWMINIVKKGKLIYFAIYCAIAGVITLILS